MSNELSYASIAAIDIDPYGNVAIESISIQADDVVLSGAWTLQPSEERDIKNILFNKLILPLCKEATEFLIRLKIEDIVEIDSFLQEARESAESTSRLFTSYLVQNPSKQDKLVEPSLMNWPKPFILTNSDKVLRTLGRQAYPKNTPDDFKRTLAASRLLKFLIDAWLSDEKERVSRKFLKNNQPKVRLLPPTWESQFKSKMLR